MARTHEVVIEVFDDVVGKPWIRVSTYEADDPPGNPSRHSVASHETTIWAEKITITDHRKSTKGT